MPRAKDFNHFVTNPVNIGISRSVQDLSHSIKFSFNTFECIPFTWFPVLPGDTISIDTSKVVRVQPMVCPVMDDLYLDTYYFFVPNRLIWDHWINFMGENTESAWTPSTEYTIPQLKMPSTGFDAGTIGDYLGVPIGVSPMGPKQNSVSALPFRAYALIMDQWFRSEVVDNPVHVYKDDTTRSGVNTGDQVTDIELGGKPYIACKMPDYFNTCTPSPQKGAPVNLFESGMIPVYPTHYHFNDTTKSITEASAAPYPSGMDVLAWQGIDISSSPILKKSFGNNYNHFDATRQNYDQSIALATASRSSDNPYSDFGVIPMNLFADLSMATPFTINDLRTAFAIQRYMERQAISGSRYIEYIKAFYNVDSPDARLQRSEYLGGNRIPLNISQVTQTSATDSVTPQGNVAGMSHTGDSHSDFTKSFTEDGIIMGICVCRYKNSYQQGVSRHFLAKTKYDFYNPVFANLGNQAVKTDEIFFETNTHEDIFGYQEAWAHYRYLPNRVAGELRSDANTPLDMWHFADDYAARPYLDTTWIHGDKTNVDRALAVTSSVSNQLIADFYLDITAARPMPSYSIPGLIDHN